MEKIIGIFDEQTVYAERFKQYINERKDVGCFAVTFQTKEELLNYSTKRKLSSLVLGEGVAEYFLDCLQEIPYEIKVWVLSEEKSSIAEATNYNLVFRYQKASQIIQKILQEELVQKECRSDLFAVLSVESSHIAAVCADKLLTELSSKGRTLFLPWDSFCGYGRKEQEDSASLSELLYLIRKDKEQAQRLFDGLPKRNGAEYFSSPEYCTDLWQYSEEEMRDLIRCCREYGNYQYVVFLCGTFHEAAVAVLRQSCQVYLIASDTTEGKDRKQEFYRQMKYAGEQEILTHLVEITVSEDKER